MVSELFDANEWRSVPGFSFTDITYHRHVRLGIVRVAFARPEVRNAFRPHTVDELYQALEHARISSDVGVVLLTGNGPSPKDGGWAFCSGGDQRIRGEHGYRYQDVETIEDGRAPVVETIEDGRAPVVEAIEDGRAPAVAGTPTEGTPSPAKLGRLHILEVQRLIRFMPKVVIAVVPGWAAGGGHSLHVVCDMTLASQEHARFKQTDADVASFDGGYGSAYLAKMVGQKRAREIFFLGEAYTADEAFAMGAVNRSVPHQELEKTAIAWGEKILGKSPTAVRMLKYAFNLTDDGIVGQQLFAGEATRLAYGGAEAREGRDAFLEKRDPDWSGVPWFY